MRIVFERVKKFHLRLNVEKCEFGKLEITFLGYLINHEGCRPTKERVEAIIQFPKPTNVMQLRKFLGMMNFYRRNLPHAADVHAPLLVYLTDSKKNDKREIVWTAEAEDSFKKAKSDLIKATLLSHPCIDAEVRVVTDASDTSKGAVLEQFMTCVTAYDRELTAIYEAIKEFKHFLEVRNFSILTDHKPLTYAFLQKSERASPRQ